MEAKPKIELFHFCPNCGSDLSDCDTQEKSRKCRKCSVAWFFNPIVGNGNILVNEHGEILLLRRAKEPKIDFWHTPGGFIEVGEQAENGARREMKEELGIHVEKLDFLVTLPNTYAYKGVIYDVLDIFFIAHIRSTEEFTLQKEEVSEYRFFKPEEIDFDTIAFDSVQKALKMYISKISAKIVE